MEIVLFHARNGEGPLIIVFIFPDVYGRGATAKSIIMMRPETIMAVSKNAKARQGAGTGGITRPAAISKF
jgi:hypothetical protein